MNRLYLSHIRIDAYGAFANRTVGPFGPGMNVVFGCNEAGKSTIASFVSGVLFGWEEARGRRNTYKPVASERAGALVFAEQAEAEEQACDYELFRGRNADGLVGERSIVADIDKETFRTMFSLSSDELRTLRNTGSVTAKLLTAGSGTESSPAHALAELDDRIAERTSRAASAECSLVNLSERMDEVRARIAEAEREAEKYRRESVELADLKLQRASMTQRIATVNDEIDAVTAARAATSKLDAQIEALEADRAAVLEAMAAEDGALSSGRSGEAASVGAFSTVAEAADEPPALDVSASEERALRDTIDALLEKSAKRTHALDAARNTYGESKARYEALLESEDAQERARAAARQRAAQLVLSVALPVVFVAAGIGMFLHGRTVGSWSFSILGAALVMGAIVLAGASLVLMFRPSKADEEWELRKQDLRWTMLQDKKRYEQLVHEDERHAQAERALLDDAGLAAADGSLRRARQLLDESASARAARQAAQQRRKAREVRLASLEESLSNTRAQRRRSCKEAGADAEASAAALDRLAARKAAQRDELIEANSRIERRIGELTAELAQALHLRDFDELKLEYQQVRTRFNESSIELARLLVARRMVAAAIGTWGSKSQPEVYRLASGLLSLMTDGKWVSVEMLPEGRLKVTDAFKNSLDPVRLSLSTCQQLYLSLRIALLVTAGNVGRNVPIIADDILVHFDATRRTRAACALAELARHRQVILLTCHEEVVEAVRTVDSSARVVNL